MGRDERGSGFPGGSDGKDSACNAGDPSSIPGLGRSSGEGRGYPFLYSLMDRGAWRAIVLEVSKSLLWVFDTIQKNYSIKLYNQHIHMCLYIHTH